MFLAARSLCTKDLPARHSMPEAMSLQKPRSTLGKSVGTNSPGLLNMSGSTLQVIKLNLNSNRERSWLLTQASA